MDVTNEFGQEVGTKVENWTPPINVKEDEACKMLSGKYASLRPLEVDNAATLFTEFSKSSADLWTYLPYGPCDSERAMADIINTLNSPESGCISYGVYNDSNELVGFAAYLRITPITGSIEIGPLAFSPKLQKTATATDTIFMMIDKAFELGYRRVEWKCNDLNTPSMNAAKRFGFTYEGTFRQAMIVKDHNRDTAWFSIIDSEWPTLKSKYLKWLDDSNFDEDGKQKVALSELIDSINA